MKSLRQALVTVFAVIFLLSAASCGNRQGSAAADSKNISVTGLLETIMQNTGENTLDAKAFLGDKLFDDNCKKLYDIEVSQLSDGGILYAENSGSADEVTVLRGKDISIDRLSEKLEQRVRRRIKDFTGYSPQEAEKLEKSSVFTCGDFAVLVISDNAEMLVKQIREVIEN